MLLYWFIRAAAWLVQRLPLSVAYALAGWSAAATFALWRRGRRNMLDNMRHVLGPGAPAAQVRRKARAALRNYLLYLVDFLRSPLLTREAAAARVSFDDWHCLDQARAAGKGTIYVGLHMGNWDLGGALMTGSGYPVNGIMETFANARLTEWVYATRRKLGVEVIPVAEAARSALRALRRNEGVAILMDRPLQPGEGGVEITFFGARTAIPAGAATLSLRTGAPIVSCAMIRQADDTFRGMVQGPYLPAPTGDPQADIRALTQQVMDGFARWVEQSPEQWYMFRRMWPEGAES